MNDSEILILIIFLFLLTVIIPYCLGMLVYYILTAIGIKAKDTNHQNADIPYPADKPYTDGFSIDFSPNG